MKKKREIDEYLIIICDIDDYLTHLLILFQVISGNFRNLSIFIYILSLFFIMCPEVENFRLKLNNNVYTLE